MPEEIIIESTIKQPLKTERLNRYKAIMFNLQMDIEAYTAIGDQKRKESAEKQLSDYEKSYWAVDAIPIETPVEA